LEERDVIVKRLGERFKVQPSEILERVLTLQDDLKLTGKALTLAHEKLAVVKASSLSVHAKKIGEYIYLAERLDGVGGEALQGAASELVDQLGQHSAVILGGLPDCNDQTKVVFVAAFGSEVVAGGLKAGKFIGSVAKLCGGGGGGRPHLAQAGGRDAKALDGALKFACEELVSALS